jgi:hypothetical protein
MIAFVLVTANRKRHLPIPLRRFFQAEWYLSSSSAHKSAFILYHFLVLTECTRGLGRDAGCGDKVGDGGRFGSSPALIGSRNPRGGAVLAEPG